MSSNKYATSSPVSPNVDDVVKVLQQKSYMWPEIGSGLGIGWDFLKQQSRDVFFVISPSGIKLAVIIDQWLESHCSEVTWDHLIEVLTEIKLHETAKHVISWLLTDDKAQKKYHWKMLPGYPQYSLINNPQSIISENETEAKRIAPPSVDLRRNPRLITDLDRPWMTRVLNDGTLVITECDGHCITLHNMVARRVGSKGQGLGDLCWPCGLAITPEGTMIVADNGNHRVQELAMDGSYQNHFGEKGDNNGEFNEPKGITIDSLTGLIYVAEIGNHRIQVFTRDFKYCNTIGNSGSAPGMFNKPYNTVFDSQGFLYVTDYGNHRIQKFTRDGRFVLEFGKKGSAAGQLKHPVGITIDDEDQLYITERHNHRVSMFTSTGQFKGCFGQQGDSQTCFNEPYGILFANGRLYVNDCSNNRVCIY